MTNDYKTKIFQFLSGHYNIEAPANNEPYYITETNENRIMVSRLRTELGKNNVDFYVIGTLQSSNILGEENEYQIVYGVAETFSQTPKEYYNFVLVLTEYQALKHIYFNYSSGTNLNKIIDMGIADDGTFYGIEYTGSGYRYAQYNNFCVPNNGVYELKLRDTANISSSDLTMNGISCVPEQIRKTYGNAIYGITCKGNSSSNYAIGTLFLTVEGGSNTWTKCPCNQTQNAGTLEDTYMLAQLDQDENVYADIRVMYRNNSTGAVGLFEGSSVSGSTLNNITSNVARGTDGAKAIFLNYTTGYVVSYTASGSTADVYIDAYINDDFINYGSYPFAITSGQGLNIQLKTNKGNVFMFAEAPIDSNYADLYVGRIWNNNLYYQMFMGANNIYRIDSSFAQGFYFVNTDFNLCKQGMYSYKLGTNNPQDEIHYLTQIFNEDNYNGFVPYQDLTSLNPTSGTLENSNGDILFARNLYRNAYSGGNSIISTLEVPSRYLNSSTGIYRNILYGYTNNEINNVVNQWTKNEYEEIYVNFINYYQVIDNTQANSQLMVNASNGVSNYIYDNTTGYNNVNVSKYRLNYSDGSNSSHLLTLNYDSVNEILGIQFSFYQDPNHKVDSIDIISQDETITYITKDTRDYEEDKIHTITMNMHIE